MQEPTILNFTGPQDNGAMYIGSTFEAIITVRGTNGLPVNLAPYSVRSSANKIGATDDGFDFNASLVDITENETIYPSGGIRLFMGAKAMTLISAGNYSYDVELELLTDDDIVVKPCGGKIRVKTEVTR